MMKYLENQVQTVGDNFQNFGSNILQDLLPSALSNSVNHDAETVPQNGNFATETFNKSVINLDENYANIDTKGLSIEQNAVHHRSPLSGLNIAEQHMAMPDEDVKKLTKSLFLLEDDECVVVNDNVKLSLEGYNGSEVNVVKEKSLSEDLNFNGIQKATSLVFETEDIYHNHEILDEAFLTDVINGLRECSSAKERTVCDLRVADCHSKNSSIPHPYELEYSVVSCGSEVGETFISPSSSLSHDSSHLSEFYTVPHKTENLVYNQRDSLNFDSDAPDVDSSRINDAVFANGSPGNKHESHSSAGHADESNTDISDTNLEAIDLCDNTKLEGSSVIVDNKLLVATSRPRRHRSYKQIILDAFTSTKRITKEYEQLGILYGVIDMESVQHEKKSTLLSVTGKSLDTKHLSTKDLGDSEWELL